MMTRILGFLPDGADGCCARATCTLLAVAIPAAAASVVPASSTLRRLKALLFSFDVSSLSTLDISRSLFQPRSEGRRGLLMSGSLVHPPRPHSAAGSRLV
jgi:hypothetical protein